MDEIQKFLQENQLDGWLMYDFCGSNHLANEVLNIPPSLHRTRMQVYFVPKEGEAILILHKIESHLLGFLKGERRCYVSFQELQEHLTKLLFGKKKVCMEVAFHNQNPYMSLVPAGFVDLVRDLGVEVVSSANMISSLLSRWSDVDIGSHKRAAEILKFCFEEALVWIKEQIVLGKDVYERDVQTFLLEKMKHHSLESSFGPIVAFGQNSASPHYEIKERGALLKKGDVVLIDLGGKEKREEAMCADITIMGFAGEKAGEKEQLIFQIVRQAQRQAILAVEQAFLKKKPITGAEVDHIARTEIVNKGYGQYFIHRTGHNIDKTIHGFGTHLDSFETVDDRLLFPSTCCSVEPGIYLPGEFGIRLEADLLIHKEGRVEMTTPLQDDFYYL